MRNVRFAAGRADMDPWRVALAATLVAAAVLAMPEIAWAQDPTTPFTTRITSLQNNGIVIGTAIVSFVTLVLLALKLMINFGSWMMIAGCVTASVVLGAWAAIKTGVIG